MAVAHTTAHVPPAFDPAGQNRTGVTVTCDQLRRKLVCAQADKREIGAHLIHSIATGGAVAKSQSAIVVGPGFRGVSVFVGGSTYIGTLTPSI